MSLPMENTISEKSGNGRLQFIDIAKLIAVCAVMYDHSQYYVTKIQDGTGFFVIRVWLFSFFLQIFFMTLGIVDREDYRDNPLPWKIYLHKLFATIIVPYFVWACILGTRLDGCFVAGVLWGTQTSLAAVGTDSILWFFPVLFWARVIYRLVMRWMFRTMRKQSVPVLIVVAAALAIFGEILSQGGANTTIWCLETAMMGVALMIIGRLISPAVEWVRNQKIFNKLILFAVLFLLSIVFSYTNMPTYINEQGTVAYRASVWMAHGYYGTDWGLFLLSSTVSCLMVLIVSMLLESCRFFAYWGRYTIGFMLLHGVLYPAVPTVLQILRVETVGSILLALISMITVGVLCMPAIVLIDRFIPGLFGKSATANNLFHGKESRKMRL